MKNIILHLGVHKTATTYFQSRLCNSIPELAEAGVGYLELNETRKYITSKIFGAFKVEGALEKILNDNEKILISDENIIGGTEKISSELIYPDTVSRLDFLINNIPAAVSEVHITIREPEDYLVSRYCEYLRHYRFMSVTEYFDSFNLTEFSWLPLIRAIEAIVGKRVTVTCFESIFDDENIYLQQLCGVKVDFKEAANNSSIRRSKITHESYRVLECLADHYPRHMTKKLMNLMDNNKQRSQKTPLKPFSSNLSSKLKENYRKDILELGIV